MPARHLTSHDSRGLTLFTAFLAAPALSSSLACQTAEQAPEKPAATGRGLRVAAHLSSTGDGVASRLKDAEIIHEILGSDEKLAGRVRTGVDLVTANRFAGVDIDFENLRYEDQEPFSRFIEELAAELHPRGRLLSVTVQPKTRDRRSDSAGSPAMAKVMKSWRPRRTSTGRSRSDHPRSPAGRREGQRGERDSARSRDPSHTSRHGDERVLSPRTARGRWPRE